jgi:hypothetical protein
MIRGIEHGTSGADRFDVIDALRRRGENVSSFEVEERYRLGERWTATIFAGLAFLYGNGQAFDEADTRFPNAGGGIQYELKKRAGIVVNLEYAVGKDDNYGFYIKLGYGF